MILVVPLVVSLVARLSGRLPLVMRYAARDAARHRTRTVPAVAAVAATVAGVVALGIANSSDEAQNQETYTPTLAIGAATVGVDADYDFNANEASPARRTTLGPGRRGDRRATARRRAEVIRGQRSGRRRGASTSRCSASDGEPIYGSGVARPATPDVRQRRTGARPARRGRRPARRDQAALGAGTAVVFARAARRRGRGDGQQVDVVRPPDDGEAARSTAFAWPALFVQSLGDRSGRSSSCRRRWPRRSGAPVSTVGYYLAGRRPETRTQTGPRRDARRHRRRTPRSTSSAATRRPTRSSSSCWSSSPWVAC